MAKKNGLGRGLDAIFDDNAYEEPREAGVQRIRLSLVDPKADQPRAYFDGETLAQLADSIAAHGVLQPILVRENGGRYEIIAGERRFRASKLAGLQEIPAVVVEADDLTSAQYALIENLQREDLNPYEEAAAYQRLMTEFHLTQEEIAGQLGKSRSAVANALRLLDLPEAVVPLLVNGTLSAGHARTLLGLRDKTLVPSLAEVCVQRDLSVREMEQLVKQTNHRQAQAPAQGQGQQQDQQGQQAQQDGEPTSAGAGVLRVDYFASLENRFTSVTGRQCKITETKNRKIFQVEYHDNEDLEVLLKHLAGEDFLDTY